MAEERSPFARPEPGDAREEPAGSAESPAHEPRVETRPAEPPVPESRPEPRAPRPAPVRRRAPRRSRGGLWVALIVGLAVLVTGGAFAVRAMVAGPPAAPAGPEDVAVQYLGAVAAGDADRAQSLAAIRVDSPTFTRAALQESARVAPITDIAVEAVQGQDVVLAYRRGGQPARGTFPMVHVAEGWRVKRPTVRVRVAPTPQMIVPHLDGQKLDSRGYTYDVELAPGTHTLSLPEAFLAFEQPQIVVGGLTDAPQVNARTRTLPSYPGELKKRLQGRIAECLEARELAPPGCPWAFRTAAGETVDPDTIRFTMGSDPFAAFTAPAPGTADAIVRGELRFPLTVTARSTTPRGPARIEDERLVIARYEADLAVADLPFVWAG